MKLLHRATVLVFACALLATSGCFSYHSNREVVEPSATNPSETTTTTTHSDDGTTQQRSTTTSTNAY
jgi:hypothetical protein